MKSFASLAVAIAIALPTAGQAFTADKRVKVNAIGNSTFEVVASGGTGNKLYWCAAAQYARSIGVNGSNRIYLVMGPKQSQTLAGRRAVHFTTNPSAAGITPVEPQSGLSVSVPGDNLSVASAGQYCYQGLRRS